ncbi:MAG: polyprenyl synthetase family protein [Candidatus Dormiibacterota bacterium]
MVSEQAELRQSPRASEVATGALAILGLYQERIQSGLSAVMATLPREVLDPAQYHLGLLPGARPGKALRPTLTMLIGEVLGADEEAALPLAVAVQLVHDFSLLHDDIVDGDRSRRGQPALWVRDGMPSALNTGDALLTAAFCVISAAEL